MLRAVIMSASARSGLGIDALDDLRIAVDEACAQLLAFREGATALTMEIDAATDHVQVRCSIDAMVPWPPPGMEASVPWQILTTLMDEVSIEPSDAAPSVRMTKRGSEQLG